MEKDWWKKYLSMEKDWWKKYLSEDGRELDLRVTNLTSLEGVALPQGLQVLDLSFTNLTSLEGVQLPGNLQVLDLHNTQLTSLEGVQLPGNLQWLDLSDTPLTSLEGVKLPESLQGLALSNTPLTSLEGVQLPGNLQKLYLHNTPLTSLEGVQLPGNLQVLYLYNTPLTSLGGVQLPGSLQKLSLYNTNLTSLPESIRKLKALKTLDLCDLKLKELPDWLPELGLPFTRNAAGECIRLHNTTVEGVDMSIFDQSQEAILQWFEERKKAKEEKAKPLNELKVVFLGDGGAGKSHTIARLLKDGGQTADFPNISTPGIVIQDKRYLYDDKEVKVHFWDFGGQEILHSMHRMFLTKRTLYVVMLNVRDGTQDDRARYWLYNLRSFAKDAPVLLVLNQMDMNENATLNESDLHKLYPAMATEVVKLSTLTYSDEDFEKKFIDVLRRQIGAMDILAFPFIPAWSRLKEKLQNMENYYIDGDKFQEFCDECGVADNNIRRDLLNWFSDLGVSFCYSGSASLEDYVVLRPDWITNAIYIILFNKAETSNNGQVSHEIIYKMLNSRDMEKYRRTVTEATYKPHEVDYVLKVFRKFRLSFLAADGIEFIPMLCEANANDISADYEDDPDALEFRMHYEYLPNNVIHRFMVDRRRELDLNTVWLYGGQFRNSCTGLSAVVKTEGNLLRIMVRREDSQCQPQLYLNDLKTDIERINAEMGLTVENTEVVYKSGDKTVCFDYEDLIFAQEMGDTHISCKELRKKIPIADILKQSGHGAQTARREFIRHLTAACIKLQSNRINWNASEDDRNTYLRDILPKPYIVLDQHLTGTGATGHRAGELDLDIRLEPDLPWTAIEALNLSGANLSYWDKHLDKLLVNYNYEGRSFLFMVGYISLTEEEKFSNICAKFRDHAKKYCPRNIAVLSCEPCSLAAENHDEPGNVQAFQCVYDCDGQPVTVYHIFVRMGE